LEEWLVPRLRLESTGQAQNIWLCQEKRKSSKLDPEVPKGYNSQCERALSQICNNLNIKRNNVRNGLKHME
jgi:hypothetical protein